MATLHTSTNRGAILVGNLYLVSLEVMARLFWTFTAIFVAEVNERPTGSQATQVTQRGAVGLHLDRSANES